MIWGTMLGLWCHRQRTSPLPHTPSLCWWSTVRWCWRSAGSCCSWSRSSYSWSLCHSCTRINCHPSLIYSDPVFTLRTQQTPKPLAQLPSAVPPISEHSLVVKQVPLSPELPAHSVFSNWTHVIRFRNLAETTSTRGYLKSMGQRWVKWKIICFV